MKPEDLQTRQMTTQELRDFLENISLHDPARGFGKCALDISEPTTTVRRAQEPGTGRMPMRPAAEAKTERPDTGPRTSALTAPLALSAMSSLPGGVVLPPGGLNERGAAAVTSAEPTARGMVFKRERVALGALAMLAVALVGALLRIGSFGSAGSPVPELASARVADSEPETRREGTEQAPSQAVAQAQEPQREPEPAFAVASEGQASRAKAQAFVGPRRAVDLLLSGETRVALEAYRALANQEPGHAAYALAVRLLEDECLRGGGGRCD